MKELIFLLVLVALVSGCVSSQEKPKKTDSSNVRLSGDVTVSVINRK